MDDALRQRLIAISGPFGELLSQMLQLVKNPANDKISAEECIALVGLLACTVTDVCVPEESSPELRKAFLIELITFIGQVSGLTVVYTKPPNDDDGSDEPQGGGNGILH